MDDKKAKILEALSLMDSMDDEQWTADGAPKVETVNALGELEGVTRAMILEAAPKFSRENFDFGEPESLEEEKVDEEVNTMGYNHPEIVAAQKAYDEAVAGLAAAKKAEREAGLVLNDTVTKLMRAPEDRGAQTKNVMDAIAASNASREERIETFRRNQALWAGRPPISALDEAKSKEKRVRPLM